MSRRRRRDEKRFYCPKCKKKTLVVDRRWDENAQCSADTWVCINQPPKQTLEYAKGKVYIYGYDPTGEKKAAVIAKAQAYLAAHPPCDCLIKTPGRDAKIEDYYPSALDLLVRGDGEPIKHHLLASNTSIYRRGFEVLYDSFDVDVVRHRDEAGVCVWLYWKCSWEPNRSLSEIDWRSLHHEAASYYSFRDIPLPKLFKNSERILLWAKEPKMRWRTKGAIFNGSLGKKKRAEIIAWVKQLEQELPALQQQATAAYKRWKAWGNRLIGDVSGITKSVSVSGYNEVHQNASINISAWLSPKQIKAIAEIVAQPQEAPQ